jgi:thioester reductase-like protein
MDARLQTMFTAPTLAKLATAVEASRNSGDAAEMPVDFDREATLDPSIVPNTEGAMGEIRNAFLTGATGFLGAFLLSELLESTSANIYCLVRTANDETGHKKIAERMQSFGLWNRAFTNRIVPVVGDLSNPRLGLSPSRFEQLAKIIDVIYHSGAAINFFYPYPLLKAANVLGTEELLRMASFGRSKSLHFISTLSVVLAHEETRSRRIINELDPLPAAENLSDGYIQSKWVADKIVSIASSRGMPVVTYRPGTIMGHSETGVTHLEDFAPSLIRGCLQAGCIPDIDIHDELHLMPVDYVSRTVVAISKRRDLFGRAFNLTNPHGVTGRELLDALLTFDPSLNKVSYERWRSVVAGDSGNALVRYIGAFPERAPTEKQPLGPRFDSEETLRIMEESGVSRLTITRQLLQPYFSYLADRAPSRTGVAAD